MPTYQYVCTECGDALEVQQRFTDDALTVCPACSGRLRKVFNAVGVVFKGSGFYRTDSRAADSAAKNGSAHNGQNGSSSNESGKASDSGSGSESSGSSGSSGSGASASTASSGSSGSSTSSSSSSGSKSTSGAGSSA